MVTLLTGELEAVRGDLAKRDQQLNALRQAQVSPSQHVGRGLRGAAGCGGASQARPRGAVPAAAVRKQQPQVGAGAAFVPSAR